MKIAMFGSTGFIGSRILAEARRRNCDVATIAHTQADILDPVQVADAIRDYDVAISAFGSHENPQLVVDAARSLLQAARGAGVPRVVVVGGAASLEVAAGLELVDTPSFPLQWKSEALAQRDALAVYRAERDVNWTYMSPAAEIFPGERTAVFRLGGDSLVVDAENRSRISAEDYAVAFMDEVEQPRHSRARFTAAY